MDIEDRSKNGKKIQTNRWEKEREKSVGKEESRHIRNVHHTDGSNVNYKNEKNYSLEIPLDVLCTWD